MATLDFTMKDLIQGCKENSESPPEFSTPARITSIIGVVGTVTSVELLFTPFGAGHRVAVGGAAILTGLTGLTGSGGGIGDILARIDHQRRVKAYVEAIPKLTKVQEFNDALQKPVHEILDKLRDNSRPLRNMREETVEATTANGRLATQDDIADDYHKEPYRRAQDEAKGIEDWCDKIRRHGQTIARLRMETNVRIEQIAEPRGPVNFFSFSLLCVRTLSR